MGRGKHTGADMNRKMMEKIVIVAIGILAVALFQYFDLSQYVTLAYLKKTQAQLQTFYAENRLLMMAAYMAIYITATALSLPGAIILTLAGGAVFGLFVGTVLISFASTIGATLACFVSRFLLRDWVQDKFGDKLGVVNEGVRKEGPLYLFTMRLIPAFPFFVINLVMGLTKMPLLTFYWISQLGMLPGTLVYVNAGKELARISSPGDIMSPGLIFSFVILGLFPLVTKKVLAFYKGRKLQ